MIRRPPRSTLFPTRRSSDLLRGAVWARVAILEPRETRFHRPGSGIGRRGLSRSEEHTSELQSQSNLVCRLLLEKKNKKQSFRHLMLVPTASQHCTTHTRSSL